MGLRPSLFVEAIATRLEAIAIRLEAIASRLEAIRFLKVSVKFPLRVTQGGLHQWRRCPQLRP